MFGLYLVKKLFCLFVCGCLSLSFSKSRVLFLVLSESTPNSNLNEFDYLLVYTLLFGHLFGSSDILRYQLVPSRPSYISFAYLGPLEINLFIIFWYIQTSLDTYLLVYSRPSYISLDSFDPLRVHQSSSFWVVVLATRKQNFLRLSLSFKKYWSSYTHIHTDQWLDIQNK